MPAKKNDSDTIFVPPLKQGAIKLRLIGETPLIINRPSAKAAREMLIGSRKKTQTERLEIKHHPYDEFRNCVQTMSEGPTLLGQSIVAIKAAICEAALETAGVAKASAQRLLFLPGDFASLYGTPMIRMDWVRNSDMNRTPDVRTRCQLTDWCVEVEVRYIMPRLTEKAVVTMACNAGMIIGIGDNRQQKGKGAFGSFRVLPTSGKNKEWDDLVKRHARKAQIAAMADPQPATDETQELLNAYDEEIMRRQSLDAEVSTMKSTRRKKAISNGEITLAGGAA